MLLGEIHWINAKISERNFKEKWDICISLKYYNFLWLRNIPKLSGILPRRLEFNYPPLKYG